VAYSTGIPLPNRYVIVRNSSHGSRTIGRTPTTTMKSFLKLLLAGAVAGFLYTLGSAPVPAFTFAVVAILTAWTLVQYGPTRPRWQPKVRAAPVPRAGATDHPLRFPGPKPRQTVPTQLTLVE